MYKKDPNIEVLKDGLKYILIDNDFGKGQTHGLQVGMNIRQCIDGWFQVYNLRGHKHCSRLSPEFINDWHRNNFKQL